MRSSSKSRSAPGIGGVAGAATNEHECPARVRHLQRVACHRRALVGSTRICRCIVSSGSADPGSQGDLGIHPGWAGCLTSRWLRISSMEVTRYVNECHSKGVTRCGLIFRWFAANRRLTVLRHRQKIGSFAVFEAARYGPDDRPHARGQARGQAR